MIIFILNSLNFSIHVGRKQVILAKVIECLRYSIELTSILYNSC